LERLQNDESSGLARFREAVDSVAGVAPYLPSGLDYVAEVRNADLESDDITEQQRRGA
jgi:hypothetical protein